MPISRCKRERADHQRALPRRRRGIVRVVVQHRAVQRIQRLVRVVLLRQRHAGTMAEALAGGEILEVEADALPIPVLADAMIGAEHGTLRCPDKPGAAYCRHDRYHDPRRDRRLPGARRRAACAQAGARRHLSRGHRRAHARTRSVRRHHCRRVWRAGSALRHLCRHRRAHRPRVDVADRHLQLAPDHVGDRAAQRHRGAEARIPAALRLGRTARRAGADRARLRHRPAGDPRHRATRRRWLCGERHQDLDQQRHPRLLLRAAGEDRSDRGAAPSRHEHAAGGKGSWLHRQPQAGETRLQGNRQRGTGVSGLPRAGGSADRRRGRPRAAARAVRAGTWPHQRRRTRRRHRTGGAG